LTTSQFADARTDFEQWPSWNQALQKFMPSSLQIYFQQHEFELAVHEVRAAQKLKPKLPKLDSLLGLSLTELSRFSDVLPHLAKGFKQSPDERMCELQL
jgi:hypothetical protein